MHKGWILSLGLTMVTPLALGAGQSEVGNLLQQRLQAEQASQTHQEQAAIAKSKRVALLTEGKAVLQKLDTLQTTILNWDSQMQAMLTSPEGKALATNSDNVEYFAQLQESPRYSISQVEAARGQVQALLEPVQAAEDNSFYAPSAVMVGAIREVGEQVRKAVRDYDQLQAAWAGLLKRSQGVQVKANAPTLAMALEKRKEEQVQRNLVAQQAARNQAIQEAQREIAEAKARKEVEMAKQEAGQINQETERLQAEAERERLIQEATSPRTIRRFQPILALGYTQPYRTLGVGVIIRWYKPGERKTPVSFEAMSRSGMLEKAEYFAKTINKKENDRPKWVYPSTNKEWEEMDKRLEQVKKYADIWIEKGLLLP